MCVPILVLILALIAIPIYLAWLVSFPYAVIRDLTLKEYRDALHWAGVALVVGFVLRRTRWGYHVYAVGGDEHVSELDIEIDDADLLALAGE